MGLMRHLFTLLAAAWMSLVILAHPTPYRSHAAPEAAPQAAAVDAEIEQGASTN